MHKVNNETYFEKVFSFSLGKYCLDVREIRTGKVVFLNTAPLPPCLLHLDSNSHPTL